MPTFAVRYTPPAPLGDRVPFVLIARQGMPDEQRFPFYEKIEIGRDDGRPDTPATILILDSEVSRRHCVVSSGPDGQCVIRDVSLNGTRIDGRRLVPNVDEELRSGQKISVGANFDLVMECPSRWPASELAPPGFESATVPVGALTVATLLVGDIRDYTVLVRQAPTAVLQQSVNRVFELLTEAVGSLGGTVKEYQGDALVAFWESRATDPNMAATACHAALELDRRVQQLAVDRTVWQVEDFDLKMDFALATGPVMISAFGGSQHLGLSMIGEPIVLAFRIEKYANDETGRILACPVTCQMAGPRFEFRPLGQMLAKGFGRPDDVFSLARELVIPRAEAG